MFLWWPSTKVVQAVMIRQKTWPLSEGGGGGGGWGWESLFSLYIYIEIFKNFLVRNRWIEFNVIWQECCFGDLLPRLFKPSWYVKKHGPQGAGLIFPIYLYRKLWNYSCQIPPDRFQCCFGDPLPRMFKQSWFVKKTWLLVGAWGLFSLYI